MGTRADFYIGRGLEAEWIGSVAWDGYPRGICDALLKSTSEQEFRDRLSEFLNDREDATTPDCGWPWPWETSSTTDYAYSFDEGRVFMSCFGRNWIQATVDEPDHDDEWPEDDPAVFPDMSERMNVTLGKRSGVILF